MRKIVAGLFMSLDGVVEAPEKWSGAYSSAEVGQSIGARIAAGDLMLLGRVTYQTFADSFGGQPDDNPMAARMNSFVKVVVSTSLAKAEWNNSTLISSNAIEEIAKLKALPGKNILVSGSITLVRSLLQADLLDELHLTVCPIVVGAGIRLFADGGPQIPLKLTDSQTFPTGVLSLAYQPANR